MSGWIKIHRSITEHWLYTEKRKFSKFEAWNDILLTVNYLPCKTIIKGKVIEVKRGESVLSLESWGKRWNWDKSSVKRFFNLLKSDDMIQLKNETVTTRLIICNYDSYQSKENEIVTQVKRRRNADETQTKPIEERKENKEEKEDVYRQFNHLSISFDEVEKLKEKYTIEQIDNILDSIENYRTNTKFTSLYLTALNWLKRENKNISNKEINLQVKNQSYKSFYE